jgi:hypothetical protein
VGYNVEFIFGENYLADEELPDLVMPALADTTIIPDLMRKGL